MDLERAIQQAAAWYKQGRNDQALRILRSVVQQDRDHLMGWWGIARAAQDPDEKLRALDEVLRINPRYSKALALRAQLSSPPVVEAAPPVRQPAIEAVPSPVRASYATPQHMPAPTPSNGTPAYTPAPQPVAAATPAALFSAPMPATPANPSWQAQTQTAAPPSPAPAAPVNAYPSSVPGLVPTPAPAAQPSSYPMPGTFPAGSGSQGAALFPADNTLEGGARVRKMALIGSVLLVISLFLPYCDLKFYLTTWSVWGGSSTSNFSQELNFLQSIGVTSYGESFPTSYLGNGRYIGSYGQEQFLERGALIVGPFLLIPALLMLFLSGGSLARYRRVHAGYAVLLLLGASALALVPDYSAGPSFGYFVHAAGLLLWIWSGVMPASRA